MQKGLTLVETLLTILIIVFLAALILPLGLSFYKNQQFQTHSQQILQTLRRAQSKAMAVEEGSSFGVYLTDDNYALFKGDSYSEDDPYNEVFDLPQIITIQDSPRTIVFSKFEGKPSLIGDIIINSNELVQIININEVGRINLAL